MIGKGVCTYLSNSPSLRGGGWWRRAMPALTLSSRKPQIPPADVGQTWLVVQKQREEPPGLNSVLHLSAPYGAASRVCAKESLQLLWPQVVPLHLLLCPWVPVLQRAPEGILHECLRPWAQGIKPTVMVTWSLTELPPVLTYYFTRPYYGFVFVGSQLPS